MRQGYTEALEERLARPDLAARVIVELAVEGDEDVRRTAEEWRASSTLSGAVEFPDAGGVRLYPVANSVFAEQLGPSSGHMPGFHEPGPLATWHLPTVELAADDPDAVITSAIARLVPRLDPTLPREVASWEMRLYRLDRVEGSITEVTQRWYLEELDRVSVEAVGGTTPVDVVFLFPGAAIGGPPESDQANPLDRYGHTVILVALYAWTADHTPAGNVGWVADASVVSVPHDPPNNRGWLSVTGLREEALGYTTIPTAAPVPYLGLYSGHKYEPAVVGFVHDGTEPTYPIDQVIRLAEVPEGAEVSLIAEGETPIGTALKYEVSVDGESWEEYVDGAVVGRDVLVGVSPTPLAYRIRVTLTPDATGLRTPYALVVGARAASLLNLDGLAKFTTGGWAFDPIELKAEISAATVTILRDGELDWHDAATEFLSENNIGDMLVRVYVGHPALSKPDWLLIDQYIVDDYDASGPHVTLDCLSVLAHLKQILPPYDPITSTRPELRYSGESLAAIYANLLDTQISLPQRFRGQGVEVTHVHAAKTFTDAAKADGKAELDAIARIASGFVMASQGRVQFRSVAEEMEPVAYFPSVEIRSTGNSPGIRQRVPEFYAPYGWSEEEDRFLFETRSFHAAALEAYNNATLDAPKVLDEVVSKWIDDQEVGDRVASQTTAWFGAGLMLISFRGTYPHPHLEIGDPVEVDTMYLVYRDPVMKRALRGRLRVRGIVQRVGDALGTDFTIWVRDILSPPAAIVATVDASCDPLAVFRWTENDFTAAIKVRHSLRPEPRLEIWPAMDTEVTMQSGVGTYALAVPPSGQLLYVELVPLNAVGAAGRAWRSVVMPGGST